jgi:hypothetical protein
VTTSTQEPVRAGGLLARAIGFVALVVAGVDGLYAIETGRAMSEHPVNILPLPAVYDAEAARVLEADPARASVLSRQSLSLRPVDAQAWLDLAVADARRRGTLSSAGVGWLERSYDVAPYDLQLLVERIALAYDQWPSLPDDLRQEVHSELRMAWPQNGQKGRLFEAAARIKNPAGRLKLALEMMNLRIADSEAVNLARDNINHTP